MNLLIFGPPGAGKGTQSALIAKQFNIKHISTGDLFRENIKKGTPLGVEAQGYMNRGALVPDDVTVKMLEGALAANDKQGFILDGFPRTIDQAKVLGAMLTNRKVKLDCVLVLTVETKMIVERLSGRRVCQKCGEVFHITARPPSKPGICDKCGSDQLIQRPDDKAEVITKRLDTFWAQTAPVKKFYEEMDLVREIDGTGSESQVFMKIQDALRETQ